MACFALEALLFREALGELPRHFANFKSKFVSDLANSFGLLFGLVAIARERGEKRLHGASGIVAGGGRRGVG